MNKYSYSRLGDVSEIIMGQSPPSLTYNSEEIGLPFFQGKAEFKELYPVAKKWCSEPNKIAEPFDILISVRAPVGSTNIANQKCCIGRGLAAIRYPDSPKYIFYYLRLIEKKLDELGTGSTFKAISGATLRNLEIPLPPLPEQKKIVEKIEELFSGLDSGVASLKKAKAQIRLYRQSVLSAAFSGKLTRSAERQAHSALKAAEPKVGYGNNLPEGWKWVKLGDVSLKITDGEHLRPKVQVDGIPFLSAKDVRENDVTFENVLYVSENDAEMFRKKCNPEKGDILIVSRGATVGRLCIIKTDKIFCLLGSVILIKVDKKINSSFIAYMIKSPQLNKQIINVSGSTAQQAIYLRDIKSVEIPLPSFIQQTQIVEEIEKRFSEADNLEKAIDESLAKSEALRQSILSRAFSGKLV